jgi:hypothetical protein
MKKIFLMLLLLPNIVFATTVYTDFEEYKMGTEEIIDESDTIKKEKYYLYNTYYEKIDSFYAPKENIIDGYQIDYNNYYFEEKNSLENSIYSINYQTKCFNQNYQTKSIILTGFTNELELSEINVRTSLDKTEYGIGIKNYIGFKKITN